MKRTQATSWITSTDPVWSEGGRISRDTQGNEVVLATPSPPLGEDGPETLGDDTQLGEGKWVTKCQGAGGEGGGCGAAGQQPVRRAVH
jgi:hypothetical protein